MSQLSRLPLLQALRYPCEFPLPHVCIVAQAAQWWDIVLRRVRRKTFCVIEPPHCCSFAGRLYRGYIVLLINWLDLLYFYLLCYRPDLQFLQACNSCACSCPSSACCWKVRDPWASWTLGHCVGLVHIGWYLFLGKYPWIQCTLRT